MASVKTSNCFRNSTHMHSSFLILIPQSQTFPTTRTLLDSSTHRLPFKSKFSIELLYAPNSPPRFVHPSFSKFTNIFSLRSAAIRVFDAHIGCTPKHNCRASRSKRRGGSVFTSSRFRPVQELPQLPPMLRVSMDIFSMETG